MSREYYSLRAKEASLNAEVHRISAAAFRMDPHLPSPTREEYATQFDRHAIAYEDMAAQYRRMADAN